MDFLLFLIQCKNWLALPSVIIFLGAGVFLTLKIQFPQLRNFSNWFKLIKKNNMPQKSNIKAISAFNALFTAMATSIGMGSIVGPSIAIIIGGPGALFWLLIYSFFGAAVRYAEVIFAMNFRKRTKKGEILGGPMQYLKEIHPLLGVFYAGATLLVFSIWMGIQANNLSSVLFKFRIERWLTGLILMSLVYFVLIGRIQRIGAFLSKLVPLRILIYLLFSFFILFKYAASILPALFLIFKHSIHPVSAFGGFMGISVFRALSEGIYKGIYITESGAGSQAIPHSMSNAKPVEQAILAMASVFVEMFICLISGLLVLVAYPWQNSVFNDILILNIFAKNIPYVGAPLFSAIIFMFILSALIGQSFNGSQSYVFFTKYKWLNVYYLFVSFVIFLGSVIKVPIIWTLADVLMPFIAIPNLIGLIILSFRYSKFLSFKDY